MQAFEDTITTAKAHNLIVIVDGKRNDIASSAEAYSSAYLGRAEVFGETLPIYDVDALTISPFLGRDSIWPFIEDCRRYGKGVFLLVKTSNPGSVDVQDLRVTNSGEQLCRRLACMVEELGQSLCGTSGYSFVGAVVGATFPEEAAQLRRIMKKGVILVPGYGAQGGTAKHVLPCFNPDGLGAIVNASRSITYSHRSNRIGKDEFVQTVKSRVKAMVEDVVSALSGSLP